MLSNWRSARSDKAISVTGKREKCALTSGRAASIAALTGSSVVFEEGVSMPSKVRLCMVFSASETKPVRSIAQPRLSCAHVPAWKL